MKYLSRSKYIIAVLLFSAVMFSLISLVNHYQFRTYCLDLGLYNKIAYDYAHFKINDFQVFAEFGDKPTPCLADHFDLYLMIFSPLVYVFGTYTLLIVQILALLLGCLGMYKLISLYTENKLYPTLAALSFSLFFGVVHAAAYDYHSNVVIASVLPWFMYCFKKKSYAWSTFLLFFMFIGKENAALFVLFVVAGLAWDHRKDRKSLIYLAVYAVCCLVYSYIILSIVMPSLNTTGEYRGFARYAQWGDSFGSMFVYLISHPLETIAAFFDHPNKVEFFVCLLLSGGIICFAKPNYLIMLIPLAAQKMLANDLYFWGIEFQYNVEMAPVLVAGVFIILSGWKKQKIAGITAVASTALLILVSVYTTTNHTYCGIRKEQVRLFSHKHYTNDNIPVREAYKMIEAIPDTASVGAAMPLLPHVSLRKHVYLINHYYEEHFADYLFLLKTDVKDFDAVLENYSIVSNKDNLYLLKKR